GPTRRIPPDLDDDSLDTPRESGNRGPSAVRLLEGEGGPRRVRGIPLDDGGDACHRHGPRRRDRLRGRRDDDRRQAGRPGLCAPARGQGPLSGDRDGGMGPSRGLLEHRRGGAHGSGPQRAGSRSRRFRTRPDPRLTGLQSGRRTGPFHGRGGRVRRQARQRGGRGDHRGPPRRERSLRRGDAGPCLRSLLALQDANPLPRDGPVVPASRADQGENGRRGRPGRVVSGMGGRGPSNGLDPEPAGLVPLPPAVLGDPAPHLAVHEVRALDRRRLLGCVAEGAGVRGRHGPAPAGDRPGRPALSEVPRGDAAGPRHPRCLVGQRGGELGEPRISRAGRRVPPVVAGGLDRRGSRPDSGLVQLAARRRRRRLRSISGHLRPEDRWLLSRLEGLKMTVNAEFATYSLHRAFRSVESFILDDLSRWYVKLVRGRTWTEAEDRDKLAAYHVLFETLRTVAVLLAPVTP